MKPTYRPEDLAFRTRVSDAAMRFMAANQTMPTHVMISGDLLKAASYANDDLTAGDAKVCGLKVGIEVDAPADTLKVVRLLGRRR